MELLTVGASAAASGAVPAFVAVAVWDDIGGAETDEVDDPCDEAASVAWPEHPTPGTAMS